MNSTTESKASHGPPKSFFNRDPEMETYGVIILLACYSIVCLAILTLNYLILRALMTTRALLPRQRNFIGYLTAIDLVEGIVSIPTFLYNMIHWPNYTFYIYEAFDCASGLASAFVLVTLSIKILRTTFRAPTRYGGSPRSRNFYLVTAGSAFFAGGLAAINVTSLMGYLSFFVFFYLAVVLLGTVVLAMAATCIVALVAIACGKDRGSDKAEDKQFRKLILIACTTYIFTWALPYTFFIFNSFCEFCIPVPAMFFYIVRFILYTKSLLMPICYFRSIPLFYKVLRKIITRDCLGRSLKY